MSMSCLRIRSSSRSSGPWYRPPRETEKEKPLSSFFFCAWADPQPLPRPVRKQESPPTDRLKRVLLLPSFLLRGLEFQRHAHRRAHISHRSASGRTCPLRPLFQNIPRQPRILLIFPSPLLHRVQQLHQRIRRPSLALNAANSRRAAAFVHLRHRFFAAENLVQSADRGDIRMARSGPLPRA